MPQELSKAELRKRLQLHYTPAIHLRKTSEEGLSQIGGSPLLPKELKWPSFNGKPLDFLAQIDLAELATVMPSFLPVKGFLYFFCDCESGWPEDAKSWRVLYSDKKKEELPFEALLTNKDPFFPKKSVRPFPTKVLPSFYLIEPDLQDLIDSTENGFETYCTVRDELFEDFPIHQMFGHPNEVQSYNMETDCELATRGLSWEDAPCPEREKVKLAAKEKWKLLLQLDSDDDIHMQWEDCGRLYFWVPEKDALQKNFDNVWVLLESS